MIKVSQLADDTSLFMKYNDIEKALKLVEEFGNVSGLKLNKDKTEGIFVGRKKNKDEGPAGIKWVTMVKSLGFLFLQK